MSTAIAHSGNAVRHAERQDRELEVLGFIRRRFNTNSILVWRTGYTPKAINRYTSSLFEAGLITRKRDSQFGARGAWFWRYSVTDEGKRAISAR